MNVVYLVKKLGGIEGLSCSGECYDEAIESLQARYNRPRLIHQMDDFRSTKSQGRLWQGAPSSS